MIIGNHFPRKGPENWRYGEGGGKTVEPESGSKQSFFRGPSLKDFRSSTEPPVRSKSVTCLYFCTLR